MAALGCVLHLPVSEACPACGSGVHGREQGTSGRALGPRCVPPPPRSLLRDRLALGAIAGTGREGWAGRRAHCAASRSGASRVSAQCPGECPQTVVALLGQLTLVLLSVL